METKTGIKLLHKNPQGILKSFMLDPLWRNREVTYAPNLKNKPHLACGPLAVYDDTPEGLEAAMAWARTLVHDSGIYAAVYRCEYTLSKDTSLWFTFVGGESKPLFYEERIAGKWNIGEIVKMENLPDHTVLADIIMLTEEIPIN